MPLVFIFDVLRLALKGLSERKLRSVLTIVGIAIGPLALVMMTSVVEGYSNYIVEQIESLGQNLILIEPRSGYRLTQNDLDFIRATPGVKKAEPVYMATATTKIKNEEKRVSIWATDINIILESMGGLKLKEGRIPSSSEIVKGVIGYNLAFDDNDKRIYRVGDALTFTYYKEKSGGSVEVKRATILISGILDKFGGAFFLSPDIAIFLSTEAGRRILGLKEWSGILVLAKGTEEVRNIVKQLENKLRDRANIISLQGIARTAESITSAINFITFSTSLSAFAVAVAGIAATMVTSVVERTREIGVMKALGFTNDQVLLMILAEGVVMSLIGGIIGISLGIVGAYILASKGLAIHAETASIVMYVSPAITPELIMQAVLITMAVGILGGIFPAYKAAKIPPAVALRYE